MSAVKITIIEDEEDIQHLLTYNLEKEGYRVTGYESGEDGLASIKAATPDPTSEVKYSTVGDEDASIFQLRGQFDF